MKNITTRQRAPHSPQFLDDTTLAHTGGGFYPTIFRPTTVNVARGQSDPVYQEGDTNIAIGNSGPVYQADTQNFYGVPPDRR